jgi:hypothetical protein
LVGRRDAHCSECGLAAPDTVAFLAVIDKQGRVLQAALRGRRDQRVQSREVVDAARTTLAEWKFRPAKLSGQPVYDWCWVSVSVR